MTIETWLYSPELMLEFSDPPFLAVDLAGVTHAIRTWRTTHRDHPGVGDYADCDDEIIPDALVASSDFGDQHVTCMTCVVRGAQMTACTGRVS